MVEEYAMPRHPQLPVIFPFFPRDIELRVYYNNKAIHYKRERRPITLELQKREEHLRAARNYGEEAEEKDRDEGEGREPREEA